MLEVHLARVAAATDKTHGTDDSIFKAENFKAETLAKISIFSQPCMESLCLWFGNSAISPRAR